MAQAIPRRSLPDRTSRREEEPCSACCEPWEPSAGARAMRRPPSGSRPRARDRSLSHRRHQPLSRGGRSAGHARPCGRRRRGLPLARADPAARRRAARAAAAAGLSRCGDLSGTGWVRPCRPCPTRPGPGCADAGGTRATGARRGHASRSGRCDSRRSAMASRCARSCAIVAVGGQPAPSRATHASSSASWPSSASRKPHARSESSTRSRS